LNDQQIQCLCQAIASIPVIISLDLTGNSKLSSKAIGHLQDLIESELLCASSIVGEEHFYCAGFLSSIILPEHLISPPQLLKQCAELSLINLRLMIGREYRKMNSPDPITDEILCHIWKHVSEAQSSHLRSSVQECLNDQSISSANNYSYHQAEIIIVRGMEKAKQLSKDNLNMVRTSSFWKEPGFSGSEFSPVMSPKPVAMEHSSTAAAVTDEEKLQPLSDTVDDYIDTIEPLKLESIEERDGHSPVLDCDNILNTNKFVTVNRVDSPVSSLGHSLATSYFEIPQSGKKFYPMEGTSSPESRQPTATTAQNSVATFLTLQQAVPADMNDTVVHSTFNQPGSDEYLKMALNGSLDQDVYTQGINNTSNSLAIVHNDTSMVALDGSRAYLDEEDENPALAGTQPGSSDFMDGLLNDVEDYSQLHTIHEVDNEDHDESLGRSHSRSFVAEEVVHKDRIMDAAHHISDLEAVTEVDDKCTDISSIQQPERQSYLESAEASDVMGEDFEQGINEMDNHANAQAYETYQYNWQSENYYDGEQGYNAEHESYRNHFQYGDNQEYASGEGSHEAKYPNAYDDQYYGDDVVPYESTYAQQYYHENTNSHADQGHYLRNKEGYLPEGDYAFYERNHHYDPSDQLYNTVDDTAVVHSDTNLGGDFANVAIREEGVLSESSNHRIPSETENEDSQSSKIEISDEDDNEDEEVVLVDDVEKLTAFVPTPVSRGGLKRGEVSIHMENVYQCEETKDEDGVQFFYNAEPNQEKLRRSFTAGSGLSSFLTQPNNRTSLMKVFEGADGELSQSFDPYDQKNRELNVEVEDPDEIKQQENPLRRYSSADLRRMSFGKPRDEPFVADTSFRDDNSMVNVSLLYPNKAAVLPPTTGQVYSLEDIDAAINGKNSSLDAILAIDYAYYRQLLEKVEASRNRSDELICVEGVQNGVNEEVGQEEERQILSVDGDHIEDSSSEHKNMFGEKFLQDADIVVTQSSEAQPVSLSQEQSKNFASSYHTEELIYTHDTRSSIGNGNEIVAPTIDANQLSISVEKIETAKPPLPKQGRDREKRRSTLDVNIVQSIPPMVADLSLLETTTIRQLDLSNCSIHDPGAIFSASPLSSSHLISANKDLQISSPWQNLIILNLSGNQIKSLDVPLPSNLKYLDLSRNLIGNISAIRILSLNHHLQYLDLSENQRLVQKQNAVLVGATVRGWFPKLALHQLKLFSDSSRNESKDNSQKEVNYSLSANSPESRGKSNYEWEHILHFVGEEFVEHLRHWKSLLTSYASTPQVTTHATSSVVPFPQSSSSKSNSPSKFLAATATVAIESEEATQHIPTKDNTNPSTLASLKLPALVSCQGEYVDFLEMKKRIIKDLLSTPATTVIPRQSVAVARIGSLKSSTERGSLQKKLSVKLPSSAPISEEKQRERDELRSNYHQKKKEKLSQSIVEQEESTMLLIRKNSIHKNRIPGTAVKGLVQRLYDNQVLEAKRREEKRKQQDEEEHEQKRNALKNVKKVTKSYYDRLTNVSRMSMQEMRSHLEAYERSILDLDQEYAVSESEAENRSLSSKSSKSSKNRQRKTNSEDGTMKKMKSKKLLSMQSSPKILRRRKSRVRDDGVFGMFTRSSQSLLTGNPTELDDMEQEEEIFVDDIDMEVDMLVEDEDSSDSDVSTVSSISRSSSIQQQVSNKNASQKKLSILSTDSMLTGTVNHGKSGIIKVEPSKRGPLLASHSFYVAPPLAEDHVPPPAVPLSPTMQSILPRRNLNSEFDIVNALIQSPSTRSALRPPGNGSLPSSIIHGGNFSPRASSRSLSNSRPRSTLPCTSSSASLVSQDSKTSSMSTSSQLSASFRLQLPSHRAAVTGPANVSQQLGKQHTKNLRRITKTAEAGKAVASEATGGLDIAEVNAWTQHCRQALGRCSILLHLLLDLATSSSTPNIPLYENATYQSICEEWEELGFIFYDTDTTSLGMSHSPDGASSSSSTKENNLHQQQPRRNGAPMPFPGLNLDENNLGIAAARYPASSMKRTNNFHFIASVPRPDFLSLHSNAHYGYDDDDEEEEAEDPWPKTLISARALGLDVTKADCEELYLHMSEFHKLFVQLQSVLKLASQDLQPPGSAEGGDSVEPLNLGAMVRRVLNTPLGQRVNSRCGNIF
jgi:hypothetical protein